MRRTIVTGLLLVLLGFSPAGASDITVGEFLKELSKIKDVSAVEILADRPLTEGDVVAISRAIGLKVTTSQPEALFTAKQVEITGGDIYSDGQL
jgi:hypothetical protein